MHILALLIIHNICFVSLKVERKTENKKADLKESRMKKVL